jgi:hypothetical protein
MRRLQQAIRKMHLQKEIGEFQRSESLGPILPVIGTNGLRCHPLWRRIDGSASDPRRAVPMSSLETSVVLGGADDIRNSLPATLRDGNCSRMIMKLREKGW